MIKRFSSSIILSLFLTSSFNVQSQTLDNSSTSRGNFFVGAGSSLNFLSQNVSLEDDFFGERNIQKETAFSLSLRGGYFVMTDLVAGLQLRYNSRTLDFNTDSGKTTNTSILAQPFVRYYFLKSAIRPFGFANFTLGQSSFDRDSNQFDFDEDKTTLIGYEAGAGVAFFLGDYFSLDLTLSYSSVNGNSEDSDIVTRTSGISSALGFNFYW